MSIDAVHHLNCATMCPILGRWFNGTGSGLGRGRIVCHCLLLETSSHGLVLVDTGIGTHDIEHPRRLGRMFAALGKPAYDRSETAIARVEALGFEAEDVRHVVCTHLDLDHAGGLADFPDAEVHVLRNELDEALAPSSLPSRNRYLQRHWAHEPTWVPHEAGGERWHGFDAVHAPIGALGDDLLMIPLAGHSHGHSGVAVKAPGRGPTRWLLHAGDAFFDRAEVDPAAPGAPFGARLFGRATAVDQGARRANIAALTALAASHAPAIDIFCAHDPVSLSRLADGAH